MTTSNSDVSPDSTNDRPNWARRVHELGDDLDYATKSWRRLPWPKKAAIGTTMSAVAALVLKLADLLPF